MKKKTISTYDEYVGKMDSKRRNEFEEGYRELLRSELLLAKKEGDELAVQKLAKAIRRIQ